VVLDGLQVASGCRLTPVRHGVSVTRDVIVYVRTGEQASAIEAIAAALPVGYRVKVTPSQGRTRFALHADAGDFIGIDTDTDVGEPSFSLRLSTGCRPVGAGGVDRADPSATPAPAALGAALAALRAPGAVGRAGGTGTGTPHTTGRGPSAAGSTIVPDNPPASSPPPGLPAGSPASGLPASSPAPGPPSGSPDDGLPSGSLPVPPGLPAGPPAGPPSTDVPAVQSVRCPGSGTAGTYTVDGVAAPADWARRLSRIAQGVAVVRSDDDRWAYRSGSDSVVVLDDGGALRVSASTPC
jgi:hypothetical protein